ncbi:hypothetical protein ASG31_17400 [Chryseobacterium sp. Leaf404]|uniref:serine hydrolase domain-containing protein n=1 Tax=unclassified Chryseobacterium TaxID=2593645 RepID=UPI0006F8BFF1|nr:MULTISPECIES: serine hydrolase domain-containing protein [unclassified Chryseobacterium]KQT20543.1 hypothetical protein ASG31_17400 [Chryseobacterium sp. Leaf404]
MRNIFRWAAFIAAFALSSCQSSSAQQIENFPSKIDSLVKIKNPRSFNGVVFIQQNGKEIYSKACGYSDFKRKSLLKISDKFSTMSIAKQITATLILQEVEKQKIDLNVPVHTYLLDFQYSWADSVTVHQLLNHTGGLYSDVLKPELKIQPGTAFSYSNVGYSVAGMILEKQTGKKFEDLVTALFKKVKMANSFYSNEKNSKLLTKGHTIKKDGTFRLNEKISFKPDYYFGSYLVVSAPDLAKWNEALHNGKLLKPETYRIMTNYTVTNAHQVFSENPIGYGYGLRINDKAEINEIGHTGFHPSEGFTAVNLYYPKTKTSVVIMENVANENFDIAYYFEQGVRKILVESELLK